jgi:hypothetical protein
VSDQQESKPLQVECPLCKGHLTVDRDTAHVLHAKPAQRQGGNFDQLLGEMHRRDSQREQEFVDAFQRERVRRELLDKKFDTAQEKANDSEQDQPMPRRRGDDDR